ncbi:MAG: T9SS type A sorting domain-containing protein [Cyclobacteriaceae bacterium]
MKYLLIVLLVFTSFFTTAQFYSQGNANFSVTTNWDTNPGGGGTDPIATDFTDGNSSFIIQDGHSITITNSVTFNIASIQVNEGGTASTLTFGDGTGNAVSFSTGNFTIQSNGSVVVDNPGAATTHILNISGDYAGTGSLVLSNGNGVVNTTLNNTSTVVISGSGTNDFNDLSIDGNGNVINVSPFTVLGVFSIGATQSNISFTSNSVGITFSGNFTLANSASFSTSGSTTLFDGAVAQTLDFSGGTAVFNNIDFDGGGTKTINGNLTTNGGTVQVINGTTIADQSAGNTHTLYNLEVNNQNALDLTGSTINFMGGEIRFGDNTATDGTIDFGVGAGGATNAANDVDIVVVEGNLTIERDDLLIMDGDITVEDLAQLIIQGISPATGTEFDATITDHDGTHTLTLTTTADIYPQGIDNFPTSFATYTFGSNSFVRYNQAYDQTIRGEDDGGTIIPYANLLVNQGGTKTLNNGENLSVAVDLYIYGGSLFTATHEADITVGDDIINNDGTSSFVATNSTLNLNGTETQTLQLFDGPGEYSLRKLIITNPDNETRTVNIDEDIILNSAGTTPTLQSLFQVSNAGGSLANELTVDLDDNTILGSNNSSRTDELNIGAFCAIFTSGAEFARDFNTAGSPDVSNLDISSTVRFDSPNPQTIPNISGSYGNIEFNGNGDKYISVSSTSLTIAGDVTRTGGNFVFNMDQFYVDPPGLAFNFASYAIVVGGNWNMTQASTAVNGANGTVTFNGTDQQISASDFENVIFSGSGTKTIQGGLIVDGDFSIPISGVTVVTSSNIDIQGNWSESAGTLFQQNGGTTNFIGAGTQIVDTQPSSFFNVLDVESGATLQLASTSITTNSSFNLRNGGTLDLDGADNSARSLNVGLNAFFDDASTLSFVNAAASIILNGDVAQNFNNEIGGPYPTLEFQGVGEKDLIDQNFDIDGDFIIASGTTVNGNGEAIDFSGANWTVDGNFLHTNTVTFSRVGTTTVSASNFNNIVIGDGVSATNVTLSGNISLENDLTITDASTLDASVGNYNIQLGQDWNGYGTFLPGTGTVTFIGNTSQIRTDDDVTDVGDDEVQATAKAFYNLRINNSDALDVIMEDDEVQEGILTVLNDFVVESGNFRFQEDVGGTITSSTLRVGGDFIFSGGILEYATADINTIELFANGTSAETHSIDLGGNVVREFQVTNNEGDTYQLTNTFEIQDDVDDEFVLNAATSTFDLNGQIMVINRGGLEMSNGTLEIDAGSSLAINDLAVDPDFNKTGGDIDLIGTSISPATLTSLDVGGFTFLQTGGDFETNNYTIANTSGDGIEITGGTITNFSDGLFTNGSGNAYLTLRNIAIGTISAPGVAFNAGPTFNVSSDPGGSPPTGDITFVIAGGTLSGSANEDDDGTDGGGNVRWLNDPGFTWNGSAADGDWTNSANWTEDADVSVDINGNDIPDEATDVVFITNAGTAPTINSSQDINIGRLTINSGSVTLNTGELNVDGNVTVFSGASLTLTQANDSLKIAGSFANDGTLTQNNGKISFDGADGSHSINSASSFTNLNINGGTDAVYSLGSALTVTDFSITGGTFDGSSGFTFNVSGDWTVSGGTFNPGIAQVRFDGATAQSIAGGTMFNARFLGAGQKNITGNISVGGELRIDGPGLVVSENASGILIFLGGDWNNDLASGFTANDGTVIFNGEGTQNIVAGQVTTFNNLTFQGTGAKNINEDVTINGDLTITTPTVNITTGDAITGVGGALNMSGGILDIEDTDNFPTGFGTVSLIGGQVRYIGIDINQTVRGGISYNNLALLSNNNNSGTFNRTLDGDVTVNGILSFGNGNVSYDDFVLEVGTNTLTLTGTNATGTNHLSLSADDDITFTGGGTLVHSGSNEWDIEADLSGVTFENVTFSGGRKDAQTSLTINGDFTINNDVIFDQNANTVTNDGDGTFLIGNNVSYFNDSGNSLPQNFGTYSIASSSLTTLNATGNQTLNTGTYGALTINSDLNVTMDGIVIVEGDFDQNSQGVLVDGGFALTLNGDVSDIQNFVPTATVTFSGGDQTINDFDGEVDNLTFLDVVFGGTGTKTLVVNNADEVEILTGGSITINPGVSVTTGELVRFGGTTFTNNGSFTTTTQGAPLTFDGATVTWDPGTNDIAALTLTNTSTVTLSGNGLNIGNGDINIGDGSVLNFGNFTHNIASDDFFLNTTGVLSFGAEGAETTIIFDRAGTQRIPFIDAANNAAQITNIPNLTFSGTGQKLLTGSLQVNDITLESTITELDIDVTNQYAIQVRGNWDNQGSSFDEHEGLVTFFSNIAATDARTITTNGDQFAELVFDGVGGSDRTYTLSGDLTVEGEGTNRNGGIGTFEDALTITRGTLDINGNELVLGNNDGGDPTPERSIISANGRLIVDEAATLSFNTDDDDGDNALNLTNAAVLQVFGRLDLDGVAGNPASFTRNAGADRIELTIESGGILEADNYSFNFLSDEGVQILAGADLARKDGAGTNSTFSNGSFNNMSTAAGIRRYIDLEADLTGGATTDINIDNITFNYDNTPVTNVGDSTTNIRTITAVGVNINFTNTSGTLGADGASYENDLPATISWPAVTTTNWTAGNGTNDWFDAANWSGGLPSSTISAVIPFVIPFPELDLDTQGALIISDIEITNGILRITDSGVGTGDQLSVTGNFSVGDGGTLITQSGLETNPIEVAGSFEINDNGTYDNGGVSIELNGASSTSPVFATGDNNSVGALLISGDADYQFNGTNITIDGNFDVTGLASINPLDNAYDLNVGGDITFLGSTAFNTGVDGEIILDGADQTITNLTADGLTLAGTGNKTLSGVTVNDIFTINSGVTGTGAGTITWDDDVVINGTFQGASSIEYTFNGDDWIAGQGSYGNQLGTVIFNSSLANVYIRQSSNVGTDEVEFHNLTLRGSANVELGRFINGAQEDGNVTITGDMTVENTIGELRVNEYLIDNSTGTGTFTLQAGERVEVDGADNFPGSFGVYAIDPTSTVAYEGNIDQTIRGGFSYGNLILNSGNTSTMSSDIDVNGDLTISDGDVLDVSAGDFTIRLAGRWDSEAGTTDGNFIARNGTVILDGTGDQIMQLGNSGTQTFNILELDKLSGRVDLQNADLVILEDFTIEDGEFDINSLQASIGGNIDISGSGFITSNAAGLIYLNAATGSPTIRMNSSNYLGNFTIDAPGRTYTLLDNMIVDNVLTITSGTLEVNGNTLEVGNTEDVINIFGTLNVSTTANPGGTLALGPQVQVIVQSGGALNVVGTSTQTGTVTRRSGTTGTYGLTVSGTVGTPGTIGARFYLFEHMDSNGISIDENGAVDVTNNFSDGSFTNGLAGGSFLRIENDQSFLDASGESIQNVVFNDNPGGGAVNVIKTVGTSGIIEFGDYTGVFSGESFDSDPNNLIVWLAPAEILWTGTVSSDWFNPGNWSTNSVPTSTDDVVIPSTPTQATLNPPAIFDGNFGGDDAIVAEAANLTVESGNSLTINTADADLDADLRVSGTVTLETSSALTSIGTDDDIEIGGSLILNGSPTFNAGTGSVFTFNSTSGLVTINTISPFNDLIIDVAGTFNILSNLQVDNDFQITATAGVFGFNGFDVTVEGNFANLSPGVSTIDAGSNTLRLSPSSASTFTFDPGESELFNVVLGDGTTAATYQLTGNLSASNDFTLAANTTLDLNSNNVSLGDELADVESAQIYGDVSVNGGETFRLGNLTDLIVWSTGNFQLAGASDVSRATLTRKGASGNYTFNVVSGGEFGAEFFNISYSGGDGIDMASGSTLTVNSSGTEDIDVSVADGNDDITLRNGTFSNGAGTAYLTLANAFTGTLKADNVVFNTGPTFNISRNGILDDLIFVDPSGSLQGPNFEDDDQNTVSLEATTGNVQWFYNNPLYSWTGTTDTDFTDDTNWSATVFNGTGPTSSNTVIIPDVNPVTDYPSILTDVTVASLTIDANAILTIADGVTLTISGDFTNSGTLNITGGGNLIVQGSITNTGTINAGATSTVTQVLAQSILFDGGSAYNNLIFDANGGTFTASTSGSLSIAGNLTITDGATLDIADASHTLTVGGNISIDEATSGVFNANDGILLLNGSGAQSIDNTSGSAIILNNVTLSGGSTKTFSDNVTVNGELILNDNSTILELGSTTLTLNGDLTLNDGSALNASTSTVEFSGTTIQRVSGSGATSSVTFNNVLINNTTAGNNDVQLGIDMIVGVSGELDFVSGIVSASASNPVIFSDNAIVRYDGVAEITPSGLVDTDQGADGAGYVSGPVTKIGDDAFVFPIGAGARLARLGISGFTGTVTTADQYSAQYFFSQPANSGATKNGSIVRVSGLENWDLSNVNAHGSEPLVTLFWDAASDVSNPATLTVAHYNGASWDDEGNASTTGNATSGTITSANNLTSFSPITIATTVDGDNPLPVELLDFYGTADNNEIILHWSTASELNNDYFEVLRSLDGTNFEEIGIIIGNGTTGELSAYKFKDASPLPGINYYMLRQVDFDGQEEDLAITSVDNSFFMAGILTKIYPNPATEYNLNISISTGDNHTPMHLKIIDLTGQVYFEKEIIPSLKFDGKIAPDKKMVSGVYFVQVAQGENVSRSKIIIR